MTRIDEIIQRCSSISAIQGRIEDCFVRGHADILVRGNGTCRTWVMAPGRNFGKRQCSVNNLNGGKGNEIFDNCFRTRNRSELTYSKFEIEIQSFPFPFCKINNYRN